MRSLGVPMLACIAVMSLAGCTIEARPIRTAGAVVVERPPAPPIAEVEVVPASPGVEYAWIPGYYRWDGHRYVWVRGRYDRRPHRTARWEPPHWETRGGVNIWVEGVWR